MPNGAGIANGIKKAKALSNEERKKMIRQMFEIVSKEQDSINKQNSDIMDFNSTEYHHTVTLDNTKGSATIIVPCYNTPPRYLEDLIFGLNNQSKSPEKVIFIDDGSKAGFTEDLRSLVSGKLKIPFEIIKHPSNQGLPAARNTGLKHTTTDYILNIDSDNVPKNDFVKLCTSSLKQNPDLVAVTTYNEYFDENSFFEAPDKILGTYKPIGASVILGQITNCFGDGTSG